MMVMGAIVALTHSSRMQTIIPNGATMWAILIWSRAFSRAVRLRAHQLSKKLTEILLSADGGRSYGVLSSDLHTRLVSSNRLLARSLAGLGERLPPWPGLTGHRTLPCRERTGSRIVPTAFTIAPLLSMRRLQLWRLSGRIRRPIGKWPLSVPLLLLGRWGMAKPWSAL